MIYSIRTDYNFSKRINIMKKLYHKIKDFLLKDTEKEGNSNDLAVILRLLSILSILLFFAMIFSVAYIGNVAMTLFLIFAIGIMLGAFICTYENHTMHGLWLYNTVTLLYAILLSVFIGWEFFFIPSILVTVLLVFFSIIIAFRWKVFYAFLCGFITIALAVIYYFLPLHTAPPLSIKIVMLILNITMTFLSFAIVASAFYLKDMKSEEKIIQYNKRLEQLVNTDALTTLWNRRAMNEHLSILVNNYNKYQTDFSVAILDIDFFKKVNDEYGHGMGDFVLKSLSYLLKTFMDEKGHVARWGGEEFLLTFEDMDYDQAIGFMEELRVRIEEQEFAFKDVKMHLTITAGIEEYHTNIGLDQVLTKADEKLYIGKTSGRNQIVSAYYSL